jgi:hypothetical protein
LFVNAWCLDVQERQFGDHWTERLPCLNCRTDHQHHHYHHQTP